MTIRVLHFFKTYLPDTFGGTERVIHALATGTAHLGIETTVLSLSRQPDNGVIDGHRVEKAGIVSDLASTPISFDALVRFRRLAREADLIHYHFPYPLADLAHLLFADGKPALVTYHADVVPQRTMLRLYRPLMNRFLDAMSVIVATSPQYVASSAILRGHEEKVEIVPLGLKDRSGDVDPHRSDHWRARFPEPFILFTGVLRYYKAIGVLLEAAAICGKPLVIVGGGPNEAHWRAHAKRMNLANVHFLGSVSDEDKDALLGLCAGLVLPSNVRAEAFGLSLVEAAMLSRAMVSCEIGTGTSYVNVDGETGYVVPPNDAAALGGAMKRLVEEPETARKMGAAARLRYEALFTRERMAAAYAELYARIVRGASGCGQIDRTLP